ncbi:MAG: hypothetical protein ACPGXK_08895 [Phycisphaerae bacterium]
MLNKQSRTTEPTKQPDTQDTTEQISTQTKFAMASSAFMFGYAMNLHFFVESAERKTDIMERRVYRQVIITTIPPAAQVTNPLRQSQMIAE